MRRVPPRTLERVFTVLAVLSLIVIVYLLFGSWPTDAGSGTSYNGHAALWVIAYLADSPTCLLVMMVPVPLFYGLCGTWQRRTALLVALALLVPLAVVFTLRASLQAWEASGNPAKIAIGRLLSGIRDAETDGTEGGNARFANTAGVIEAVRDNGWMRLGAGPAADVTYFSAEHLPGSGEAPAGVVTG